MLASDNDPLAVGIAGDNARKNERGTAVARADGARLRPSEPRQIAADLLLANLLERALYHLAPERDAPCVEAGGTAILSGLTETQARAIEARSRAFGFIRQKQIILDGWTSLRAKPSQRPRGRRLIGAPL